jgi:transcriptional regulator with XRE-family HTH domain
MRESYHQATMAMTAEEFRKTIAKYGMSQGGACRFLGIAQSTLNDYATGRTPVPALIEIIFALMRHCDVFPAVARRIAGLPPENYGDGRRNRVYVGRKRKFVAEMVHSAAEQRERVRADRECRKPKLSDYQREEAIKRCAAGETLRAIAESYGVHIGVISRLSKKAAQNRISDSPIAISRASERV